MCTLLIEYEWFTIASLGEKVYLASVYLVNLQRSIGHIPDFLEQRLGDDHGWKLPKGH